MDQIKQLLKDNDAKVDIIKEKRKDSENFRYDTLKTKYCIDNFGSTRTTTWKDDEEIRSSIELIKLNSEIEKRKEVLKGLDNFVHKKQMEKIRSYFKDFTLKKKEKKENNDDPLNNAKNSDINHKASMKDDIFQETHQFTFHINSKDYIKDNTSQENNTEKLDCQNADIQVNKLIEIGTQTLLSKELKSVFQNSKTIAKSIRFKKLNKANVIQNTKNPISKSMTIKPKVTPLTIKGPNKTILSFSQKKRSQTVANPSLSKTKVCPKSHQNYRNTFSFSCNKPRSMNKLYNYNIIEQDYYEKKHLTIKKYNGKSDKVRLYHTYKKEWDNNPIIIKIENLTQFPSSFNNLFNNKNYHYCLTHK